MMNRFWSKFYKKHIKVKYQLTTLHAFRCLIRPLILIGF